MRTHFSHLNGKRHSRWSILRPFTLVELLVVIVIIAILASLLFPALKGALNTAKRIQCMTMEKGIWHLVNNYAGDYKGYSMPLTAHVAQSTRYKSDSNWFYDFTMNYLLGMNERKFYTAKEKDTIIRKHWSCPGANYKPSPKISYWSNTDLLCYRNDGNPVSITNNWNVASNAEKLVQVPIPSQTILVPESVDSTYDKNGYSNYFLYPYIWHSGQTLNSIFVDGHGESLNADFWMSINYFPSPRKNFSMQKHVRIWRPRRLLYLLP